MRSLAELTLLACLVATNAAAATPPSAAATPASAVPLETIEQAVQQLRDEGHFGRKRPERYLRLKPDKDDDEPEDKATTSAWWRDFTEWLGQIGRIGVWTLGALCVALLAVLALRARRQGNGAMANTGPLAPPPQRVRQYDIRPESLPADVGASAWAQWVAGERQAALVLLYRGALSRLVHLHAVPIKASSTEGDCMALCERHAPGGRSAFFSRVARARLLGRYAGRWPEDDEVQALCNGFAASLSARAVGKP